MGSFRNKKILLMGKCVFAGMGLEHIFQDYLQVETCFTYTDDYAMIVIQDGMIPEQYLEKVLKYKAEHPETIIYLKVDVLNDSLERLENPEAIDIIQMGEKSFKKMQKKKAELLHNLRSTYIITRGSKGIRVEQHQAVGFYNEFSVAAPNPGNTTIHPYTCGDSVCCGVVAGLASDLDLFNSVRLATFLAGQNLQFDGVHYPRRHEYEYFMENLQCDNSIFSTPFLRTTEDKASDESAGPTE